MRSAFLTAVALALATAGIVQAQSRPRATVTPFVEADGVHAGASARVALTVTLPEGLHVQSDQPRDPSLIPTVLTVDAPAGVRVTSLVFPHPKDFKREGQAEPLAVFERDFVVGAELSLESGLPEGELSIPARLRYQACDDKVCFQPRTETTEWKLRVVAPATKVAATAPEVFTRLSAGRKTDPPAVSAAAAAP